MADMFNLKDPSPGSFTWRREAAKYCNKCLRKNAIHTINVEF